VDPRKNVECHSGHRAFNPPHNTLISSFARFEISIIEELVVHKQRACSKSSGFVKELVQRVQGLKKGLFKKFRTLEFRIPAYCICLSVVPGQIVPPLANYWMFRQEMAISSYQPYWSWTHQVAVDPAPFSNYIRPTSCTATTSHQRESKRERSKGKDKKACNDTFSHTHTDSTKWLIRILKFHKQIHFIDTL
jgi:hypothetical protein